MSPVRSRSLFANRPEQRRDLRDLRSRGSADATLRQQNTANYTAGEARLVAVLSLAAAPV